MILPKAVVSFGFHAIRPLNPATAPIQRRSMSRRREFERFPDQGESEDDSAFPVIDFSEFAAGTKIASERRRNPRIQRVPLRPAKEERNEEAEESKSARSKRSGSTTPRSPRKKTEGNSPSKKARGADTPRTTSFAPLTGSSSIVPNATNKRPPPHTLILGTHPSMESLRQAQYYGHPMNAFWWIAGDCLGFRRGSGVSDSTGQPYGFTQHLRHKDNILSYPEQLECMLNHGFYLWDVVASCQRPGSLDRDITEEVPNDIPALCQAHPSIRRIVLANGGAGCNIFLRHFRNWMQQSNSDNLINFEAGTDHVSQQHFAKACQKLKASSSSTNNDALPSQRTVTLVSAMSVSPAAARFTYLEKRNFWETNVYHPGLNDFRRWKEQQENGTAVASTQTNKNDQDDN